MNISSSLSRSTLGLILILGAVLSGCGGEPPAAAPQLRPVRSIVVEATGVSWLGASPGWSAQRVVNVSGGLRFVLPRGFQTGLWLRAPVTGREADDWGDRLFLGLDVVWRR